MSTIVIIRIFAFVGLLDTLYLIYHTLRGSDVACIGFPRHWCQKVQRSPQAKTFGVPNSVAGFVLYVLIFLLTTFAGPTVPAWYLQFLVLFGFLFSLYFMYVQIAVLRALCTWCVISFLNFTVMAWALFLR